MAPRRKDRMPRPRGELGFSVPEAGKTIGLGINASYAAAKRGEIPTLIVPRAVWLRKLGVKGEADLQAELALKSQEDADRQRRNAERKAKLLAELEAIKAA